MPELDPWKHADFIYACYIVVGVGIGLLSAWIVRDERKQRRLVDELEKQAEAK